MHFIVVSVIVIQTHQMQYKILYEIPVFKYIQISQYDPVSLIAVKLSCIFVEQNIQPMQ